VQYKVNDKVRVSLAITNLFDTRPPVDDTWVSYPYYNTSWYDGLGRSGFLQVTYKLD
jgi:outer membrane receptor protein involved in Fe transport